MKLNTSFTIRFLVFFLPLGISLQAQVTIGPNLLGINAASPQASLSVNGDGNANYGAYITSTAIGSGVSALYAELPKITSGAVWNRVISGRIESGEGFAAGVDGFSYSNTPSNDGRSYGVYGTAGNATSNYNYGVFGRIRGSHAGAGILGWDEINRSSWDGSTNGTWAGYFVGDVEVDGKLAIGTTDRPTSLPNLADPLNPFDLQEYKLFVCGGILADEWLIPNQAWCDYVFDESYQLMPLAKVEQHIEAKGHLHNTPSAEEIESTGLEMGKITVNQQEKIEEIFLHLIDMNKRLSALEQDNADLKKENALLKTQLKARQANHK